MTPKVLFDLLEAWREGRGLGANREIRGWAEDVQWYEGYACSNMRSAPMSDARWDYAPHGIVAANWNTLGRYDPETRTRIETSDVPKRMGELFERLGVKVEWSDQVTSCSDCGQCVQTEPDSYGWQPDFILGDGEILCSECATDHAEDLLAEFEGEPNRAWNNVRIDPADHGYVRVEGDYEAGWHPGQDADPKLIAKAMRAAGVERFLFRVDDVGQFDSRFSVYVHEDEIELLDKEAFDAAPKDGPSRSAALDRGLREAALVSDQLQGEGVKYVRVEGDRVTEARVIPQDEFVKKGIKP